MTGDIGKQLHRLMCELYLAGNKTDVHIILGKNAYDAVCAECEKPIETPELCISPGFYPSFYLFVRRA